MSDIINILPPEPRKALLALSIFRFLTVKQLVRLGVSKSEAVVRNHAMYKLESRARKLADSKKIGTFLPKVHFLTKHGAEQLAELYRQPIEDFPYPKGKVQFGELFAQHRFAQVDFHIGLREWAHRRGDTTVLFSDLDFDVTGSRIKGNMVKATEISLPNNPRPVIPDGVFGVEVNGSNLIYAMEIHRQTQTKAVGAQIARYIDVLEAGAISFKYGLKVSPIVCSVHTKEAVLKGTKAHLMQQPDFLAFKGAFVFNTAEQLAVDFSKGWTFADDTPADPFPLSATPHLEPLIQ